VTRLIAYLFDLQALFLKPQQHAITQTGDYLLGSLLGGVETHAVNKGRVVLKCLLAQMCGKHVADILRHGL